VGKNFRPRANCGNQTRQEAEYVQKLFVGSLLLAGVLLAGPGFAQSQNSDKKSQSTSKHSKHHHHHHHKKEAAK
jgi:hypothetical protein